ncbi:hypothetical protein BCR33DRAFT_429221 [Rhizoclosmatium globosum]|uniref:Uncharacterized protein n=1 Tax=Rhizoclosmatium globosum TaxID=329046 RepID=A0A1Y2BUP0_9FUNG|nr:hypothetical protein BCR33DRAFT_429221 [Rhizoclosmatium globosum]|eukprot:ORY38357.1 hypothetical protein BCR33DRAFT_429221 [Rhizoclosmatium globosum]
MKTVKLASPSQAKFQAIGNTSSKNETNQDGSDGEYEDIEEGSDKNETRLNRDSMYCSARPSTMLRKTLSSQENGLFSMSLLAAIISFKEEFGNSGAQESCDHIFVFGSPSKEASGLFSSKQQSVIDPDSIALSSCSDMKTELTQELITVKAYADQQLSVVLEMIESIISSGHGAGKSVEKPMLRHSSSWPPYLTNSSQDIIIIYLQETIDLILETPCDSFIGTSRAADLMRKLQSLLLLQRQRVIRDNAMDELLGKAIFAFSSVSRASENLNHYVANLSQLEAKLTNSVEERDENMELLPSPILDRTTSSGSKKKQSVISRPSTPNRKRLNSVSFTSTEPKASGLSANSTTRRLSTSVVTNPSPLSSKPYLYPTDAVDTVNGNELGGYSGFTPRRQASNLLVQRDSDLSLHSYLVERSDLGCGKKSRSSSMKPPSDSESNSPRPLRKLSFKVQDGKYSSCPSLSTYLKTDDAETEENMSKLKYGIVTALSQDVLSEDNDSAVMSESDSRRASASAKPEAGTDSDYFSIECH